MPVYHVRLIQIDRFAGEREYVCETEQLPRVGQTITVQSTARDSATQASVSDVYPDAADIQIDAFELASSLT